MLQKPGKGSYNKLSRRQVLKVLGCWGLGVGVLGSLSGCTQLPTPRGDFRLQAQDCETCEDIVTAALKRLDPRVLNNTRQNLKHALKALHKAQSTKQIKKKETLGPVNAAHEASLHMALHLKQTGFCQALDQELPRVILHSESLNSLPEKVREEFIQDLKEVGIPTEAPWVQALLNSRRQIENDERQQMAQMIAQQGSYELLRQKTQALEFKPLRPQSQYVDDELLFYSDDWVSCALASAACLLLIALAIAACYTAYQAPSWPTIEKCLEAIAKALAACGLAWRLCFSS